MPGILTILVVDDSEPIRHMVASMLDKAGFRVLAAPDGLAALQLIENAPTAINLVLTDVIMPHMGGAELARRLAKLAPKLPVVFMTGYTNEPISGEFQGRPPVVLAKPFSAADLHRTLKGVFGEDHFA